MPYPFGTCCWMVETLQGENPTQHEGGWQALPANALNPIWTYWTGREPPFTAWSQPENMGFDLC